ncbi:hypothetical protein F1737_05560 [Methanoplanus sp. FWC-SCC4]|uniref:Transposase IS204/IS1001/IS1096/IS1165 zinc-finger domain-containing protein n=1 Tax=Methanochimaera problematica TaxID=2609417 RepID=A0AA97I3S8_9EURY|nr:hypothetical protein [Methanoplanus sp. FWC-SCC4]WOF16211.1 hypothetical protein F1737_05560 [Methanoplanus sp. FWC-SCC4]
MLSELIQSGIMDIQDTTFDRAERCPECGGALAGHDIKRKKFATVLEDGNPKEVCVNVKRFRCRECGKLVYAKSPFYSGIRTGTPIVDFCIANKNRHPANHISKILKNMSIFVNPGSVRNYERSDIPSPQSVEFFGINFPISLLNLSGTGIPDSDQTKSMLMMQMIMQKRR